MSKSIGFYCPHCERRMHVTSRKRPSRLLHTLIVTCQNPDCLATYSASVEIDRPIHQSINPNPEVPNGTGLHNWEANLEHQLASLELQQDIDQHQRKYVEGIISALLWAGKIDLRRAQEYTRRLQQMKLL